MSWAGAANIEGGITIDLSAINQVSVSGDHTVTSVGGGARWQDVYLKLDAMNLAVSGGRVSEVGVGGLITGGMRRVTAVHDMSRQQAEFARWQFFLCVALWFCMRQCCKFRGWNSGNNSSLRN